MARAQRRRSARNEGVRTSAPGTFRDASAAGAIRFTFARNKRRPIRDAGVEKMRAPKPDAALVKLRNLWLWSSPPIAIWGLSIEQENRLRLTWQKRVAKNAKFDRSTNGSKQWEQFRKLRRFYAEATFGTALSTTEKRSRAKL